MKKKIKNKSTKRTNKIAPKKKSKEKIVTEELQPANITNEFAARVKEVTGLDLYIPGNDSDSKASRSEPKSLKFESANEGVSHEVQGSETEIVFNYKIEHPMKSEISAHIESSVKNWQQICASKNKNLSIKFVEEFVSPKPNECNFSIKVSDVEKKIFMEKIGPRHTLVSISFEAALKKLATDFIIVTGGCLILDTIYLMSNDSKSTESKKDPPFRGIRF